MARIHDAVAAGRVVQGEILGHAGEVVPPVQTARDDQVVRACRPHRVHQGLHARRAGVVILFFVLLSVHAGEGVLGRIQQPPVAPDFPGHAVRFIPELEDHAGMILVTHRGVLPEGNRFIGRRPEAVQVQHQVGAARIGGGDGVIDQFPVGDASFALLLIRAPTEPEICFDRQANDVRFPVARGYRNGLLDVLALARPFHAVETKTLEPDAFAIGRLQLVAHDVDFRGKCRGIGRNDGRGRNNRRRFGNLVLGGREDFHPREIETAGSNLEQSGHDIQRMGPRRHRDEHAAVHPAGGTLPERGRRDAGPGHLLAVGVLEMRHDSRVEPRFFADNDIRVTHSQADLDSGRGRGGKHHLPINEKHLARLRGLQVDEVNIALAAPSGSGGMGPVIGPGGILGGLGKIAVGEQGSFRGGCDGAWGRYDWRGRAVRSLSLK